MIVQEEKSGQNHFILIEVDPSLFNNKCLLVLISFEQACSSRTQEIEKNPGNNSIE